ncbi:MAG TPA: prepilin-type N-terminal cleavage/methylation domain-containing protein [Rhodoferax sp.]
MSNHNNQRGFTLIELIMVIVIMGVIAGMVTVFMKSPIDAYFASARRAALTDVADTVVRRMARDIQRSLPNSIRSCPSGTNGLEFIPTKTGGRYRTAGPGALDFVSGSSNFNMLGKNSDLPPDQQIKVGDVIVVYNLGIPDATAYPTAYPLTGSVNTAVVGGTDPLSEPGTPVETTIPLTNTTTFPLESGTNRFHVVPGTERMVSYVCSGINLLRVRSTTITAAASCPTATTGSAFVSVIASNVNCATTSFNYSGSDLQRNALVSMVLTVTDIPSGESVTLQHEVHVSNTP